MFALRAKAQNQKLMPLESEKNDIIFALGPAGPGKNDTTVALAVRALKIKVVRKIILARPTVETGESHQVENPHLKKKINPYLQPFSTPSTI